MITMMDLGGRAANRSPKAVRSDKRAEFRPEFEQVISVGLGGSDKIPNGKSVSEMDISQHSDVDSSNTDTTDSSSCCVSTTSGHKQIRFESVDDNDDARQNGHQQKQQHTIIAHVPLRHEMELEQRNALWWNEVDYANFSTTAKNIAHQVRQHPALTCGLEEAYRRAEAVSKEVESVEDADPYLRSMVFDSVRPFRWLLSRLIVVVCLRVSESCLCGGNYKYLV